MGGLVLIVLVNVLSCARCPRVCSKLALLWRAPAPRVPLILRFRPRVLQPLPQWLDRMFLHHHFTDPIGGRFFTDFFRKVGAKVVDHYLLPGRMMKCPP